LEDVLTNDRLRWTLGLGATVGIATMAAVLVPAMFATGFKFRPNFDVRHPAVRKLLSLSFWTIGFVIANQVALVVVRNLAEGGSSDNSAYINAFTFFVLPHGLLAVSIATTFQPEMSRSVARRDRRGFVDQASLGLRMTALFTIPAGVGIFVMRQPIIGALLQRGEFSAADADAAQRALAGLALGLGAFSIYMFVLRGFYAHKDTKTPFLLHLGVNVVHVLIAIPLVAAFGVVGLGVAYTVAYSAGALVALGALTRHVGRSANRLQLSSIERMGQRDEMDVCAEIGRGRR
jgi:putative peptidoglycan lipid II flippase